MKTQQERKKERKLSFIEKRYGRDFGEGTMETTVKHLERLGYISLADFFRDKKNDK